MNTRHTSIALLTVLASSFAGAVSLTPNNSVFIDTESGATFQGSQVGITQSLTFASSPSGFTGTLEAQVWSFGGTLDFYYRAFNDSSSAQSLHRIVVTGFGGYSTDVSWVGTGAGDSSPYLADRSAGAGASVGFDFANGLGDLIAPGESSKYLRIRTNATQYNASGSAAIIDGTTADLSGVYAPVPEPMTLGLAGVALLAAARRRRARQLA